MYVVALIGESGSGKSYKAIMLSSELDIEYIVDDGLLIKGHKIIAGKSAKRENTKISAVKRAVFMNYTHRLCVREAIKTSKARKILIIGTSNRMVDIIADALELGHVDKRIYIEDVSSTEEIETAKRERSIEGKHIIPVPTFEVKKHFSGYFMDSLKILKKRDDMKRESYEKTVVRPTFSYLGKYKISDDVIKDIIRHNISKEKGVARLLKANIENYISGIFISIEISLFYSYDILKTVRNMQMKISKDIEHMTSLNILAIDVTIRYLEFRK